MSRLDRVAEVSIWLRNSFPTLSFAFYRSEERMCTIVEVIPKEDLGKFEGYRRHEEVIDLDKWPDEGFITRMTLIA